MALLSPYSVATGTWHHLAIVYDRTNVNVGNFSFYLNGALVGSDTGVVMGVSQSAPVVLGGHSDPYVAADRWFDGRMDDLAVWRTALTAAQVASLTNRTVAHFGGLASNATVSITVRANEPFISEIADRATDEDTSTPAIPFTIGDAQTSASNLTVTVLSSNPSLIPVSNVVVRVATNPWTDVDIGAVTAPGFCLPGDVFTMSASGADIWGTADEGHLLYQPITGDGEMVARVASVQPTDPWSKAGVMMRADTNAGSTHFFMLVSASNGVAFQRRLTNGSASLNNQVSGIRAPCWVRLAKTGTNFAAYYATDNAGSPGAWIQVGPTTPLATGATILRGLAGTSHKDGVLCTSTFDHVSGPANVGGNRTVTAMPASNANGTATISLIVSDGTYKATNAFVLTVNAINDAPVLAAITNRTLGAGQILSVTNVATDIDLPAQALTFYMLACPTGAAVGATNGIVTWRPAAAQANSTNLVRVKVADNGMPALGATQQFSVIVRPLATPAMAQLNLTGGLVRLSIGGDAGPDYIVQASTNLTTWNPIFTNNPPALPLFWTDTNTFNFPRRFYRVRLGP